MLAGGPAVTLSSAQLAVTVLPQHGCDIASIVVRERGIELLWQPPWGRRPAGLYPYAHTSLDHWLHRTGGGWNLLLPNAGADTRLPGVTWGFHGEAAQIPWQILDCGPASASFRATLMTAPLTVQRTITVEGLAVEVHERVTNDSPGSTRFAWGHHPTFTAPLIAPGTRFEAGARAVRFAPAGAGGGPGGGWPSGQHTWPHVSGTDLSVVPPGGEPRALLAYLSGLAAGTYRITNHGLGLGVEVTWPTEVWPVLWLWQELHGTGGYPWFRRTYAMAAEPQSSPAEDSGPAIGLPGGGSLAATITLRAFTPAAAPPPARKRAAQPAGDEKGQQP